jgi:hypothetical protein
LTLRALVIGGAVLFAGLGVAAPVFAQSCNAVGTGPDISFEFHLGPYDEDDETDFAQAQLRERGVDAERVEKWGGCYRAFVRDRIGTHFEYFNSRTFDPVY